jgi:hypothetical protein
MRLILLLILGPIVILACALAVIWLPLPGAFPPALSKARNQMAALLAGGLALIYLVALFYGAIKTALQPARLADEAFRPLGIAGQNYLLLGRQYNGDWQGRQLQISFVPGRFSSAVLQVYLQADLGTRAAIGRQRPLLDCRDCRRVTVAHPEIAHLYVVAQDALWLERLLADEQGRTAVRRLMTEHAALRLTAIYFQPERIWLYAHPQELTAAQVEQWMDDLLTLCQIAEGLE